jgi:hypothetical protein
VILLEPDCLVSGAVWRHNLLKALDQGAWMAGGFRQKHGPIHITPSAWLVNEVRASFRAWQWRAPDEAHPRFRELVDLAILEENFGKHLWRSWAEHWDAGQKPWFEAAVRDRTALVEMPGFHHFWLGSSARRLREGELIKMFPETEPYFGLARTRLPRRQVDDCPYRKDRSRSNGAETARCEVLVEAAGRDWGDDCHVSRDACEACCGWFPPSPAEPNPVIASLIYNLTEKAISDGGAAGASVSKAAELQAWAQKNLAVELPG